MQRPEWSGQQEQPSESGALRQQEQTPQRPSEPLPAELERAGGPQSGASGPVEEAADHGSAQKTAEVGDQAGTPDGFADQRAAQQVAPQTGEPAAPPTRSDRQPAAPAASEPAGSGDAESERLRGRWDSTYARFVNDPSGAAQEADSLVGEMLGRLTAERDRVRSEMQADSAGDQTERQRRALLTYRAIFDRLA